MNNNENGKKDSLKALINDSIKELNEMAEVSDANGQFRKIIMDQLSRVMTMEENADNAKDFAALEQITIGICPGDGIGPSISEQTQRVLEHLLKDELASGRIVFKQIEGLTIENRLQKMEPVPADVLEEIKTCDVLLKGPTTTPKEQPMPASVSLLSPGASAITKHQTFRIILAGR